MWAYVNLRIKAMVVLSPQLPQVIILREEERHSPYEAVSRGWEPHPPKKVHECSENKCSIKSKRWVFIMKHIWLTFCRSDKSQCPDIGWGVFAFSAVESDATSLLTWRHLVLILDRRTTSIECSWPRRQTHYKPLYPQSLNKPGDVVVSTGKL